MQNIVLIQAVAGESQRVRIEKNLLIRDDEDSFEPLLSMFAFGLKVLNILEKSEFEQINLLFRKVEVLSGYDGQ